MQTPQPQPPHPQGQVHCSFCAVGLTPDQILYTPDARVACVSCNAKVEIAVADVNVGSNIIKASVFSISAAAVGLVMLIFPSWPFRGFAFAMGLASIWAGIYAMRAVNRRGDERFTRHVQKDKGIIYACSIIGFVLATLVVLGFMASTYFAIQKPKQPDRFDFDPNGSIDLRLIDDQPSTGGLALTDGPFDTAG